MATNPYVNKVIFGNMTLIDTSNVTVTPDKLAEGYTALDASGALITGTAKTGGGNTVYYGECSTGAGTAAKTVTIDGITELTEGLSIRVKFANAQTYNGAPTLNLNSLGAKNIRRNGTTNAARYEWLAGEVLDLVYDGAAWLMVNGSVAYGTYTKQEVDDALYEKQNKLTFDTFPRDGSRNPVTSDGIEEAIVRVAPVIYNKVITGVTVSSDNGYSAAIPYYTISRDISYDKIIGCILTGWSANAVLAPQLYSDGLYIYSTKAFSNGNVHLRLMCLPNME